MRAKRKDENQNELAKGLEAAGWSVHDTSGLGYGFPDLLVGKPGFNVCLEVKDGNKPPSARKLTPAEQRFKDNWTGPYALVESLEDALKQLEQLYARSLY